MRNTNHNRCQIDWSHANLFKPLVLVIYLCCKNGNEASLAEYVSHPNACAFEVTDSKRFPGHVKRSACEFTEIAEEYSNEGGNILGRLFR